MNLRAILRHQYIAAIVVALLTLDGLKSLVSTVLAPLEGWVAQRMEQALGQQSIMVDSGPLLQPPILILRVVTAAMYLAVAAVIFRWIYWERPERLKDSELLEPPSVDLDRTD